MAERPVLMGLDLGTSSIRALAFDASGTCLAEGSVPTPVHRTGEDHAHYEPDETWGAVVQAIRTALAGLGPGDRVVGIAAASVGEAAVPVDADGQPTHPAIAWFDKRTEPQCRALAEQIGGREMAGITGLSVEPIFGIFKVKWIQENAPEAYARTKTWLNMADYAAFRLCGVAATDYSLASRTYALDLGKLEWSDSMIRGAGIDAGLFPPLRPSGAPLGAITSDVADATGLPRDCVVAAGGHDHICGALASGAFRPGVTMDSMGSAEAILQGLSGCPDDFDATALGMDHGVLFTERPNYFRVGGCMTSGVSVEWSKRLFDAEGPDGLSKAAAAAPPGSGGVRYLPHLRYATPPCRSKPATGVFWGLHPDVTRAEMCRAVLEGIAFDVQRLADAMADLPGGRQPAVIRAIGGSARNDLLMAIKAALAPCPIVALSQPEAVSQGAAILAGVAAGIYPDADAGVDAIGIEGREVPRDSALAETYEALYRDEVMPAYDQAMALSRKAR